MDGQKACENMLILTSNYRDEFKGKYSFTTILLEKAFESDNIKH